MDPYDAGRTHTTPCPFRPRGAMFIPLPMRGSMRSYAHGTTLTPLLGDTIGENLRRTVERHGDRDALVVRSQDYRATYRELYDATSVLARALIASGIEPRDRVGIWSPNRYEWVVAQFATASMGAILVNINPAYKSSELRHVL